LFPEVRAKVFELLFGATVQEYYVRELALRSHLALHTVQDELRKLSAIELVTSRSTGLYRYYQANRRHALYPAICQIVSLSGQLPTAHVTALRRLSRKGAAKPKGGRRANLKVPYRPINWGIFEKKS
jgi:hypothetical protein